MFKLSIDTSMFYVAFRTLLEIFIYFLFLFYLLSFIKWMDELRWQAHHEGYMYIFTVLEMSDVQIMRLKKNNHWRMQRFLSFLNYLWSAESKSGYCKCMRICWAFWDLGDFFCFVLFCFVFCCGGRGQRHDFSMFWSFDTYSSFDSYL